MSIASNSNNRSFGYPTLVKQPLQNVSPAALGVNVHCFIPQTGKPLVTSQDFDLIKAAGFQTVRIDMLWQDIEKQPGVFDFKSYDWVINQLSQRGIRPMIILGFGNPLYTATPPTQSAMMQQAFKRYALASVQHFQGRGIVWELVNEPNLKEFWLSEPDADAYMILAKDLLPRLRKTDPSGFFVAPSTAGVPLNFLDRCFQQGLLSMVDGVTIHPYQAFPRNRPPESFAAEYEAARTLMNRYPDGKPLPLLLGEWGYSTARGELNEQTQANFAVRQALLGWMMGTPVNIWYNWKGTIEGETNSLEKEDQFGLLDQQNEQSRLKPAYWATREMSQALAGKHFIKRLPSNPQDYCLAFSNGAQMTIAAWTIGTPHLSAIGDGRSAILTGKPSFYSA